jgi:hypothetical protein
MRILPFALIILASTVPLQADNLIQNGDFTDGSNHWKGDGKSSSDYANDNPSASSDPFTSKGLIVQLDPNRWTKVSQVFKGNKSASYVFTINYMVSPDLSLSQKPDDYKNITDKFRVEGFDQWTPVNIGVGQFFDGIVDLGNLRGFYEKFSPKLGKSEIQKFDDAGPPIAPGGDKVVAVAFPPGTGTVVILNISVTSR